MARVVGIDHLVLRVKDIERSRRFYDLVLGFLGFKPKYHFADAVGWSNGKTLLWIGEADAAGKEHPHRLGNIGFHHYAFELGKRQDVDDLYALLKRNKVNVVDPPADYPDYGEGYYAVFFTDPDGLKLEGMALKPPRRKPKRSQLKAPSGRARAGPGRRNFAHTARYKRSEPGHRHMRYWTSQIVIGIIVTVVGTVLANVIIKAFGSRKHVIDGAHYSGPARAGR